MNTRGDSALFRLVNNTGKDRYLFQDGNISLWSPTDLTTGNHMRYIKSTREFVEVPFGSDSDSESDIDTVGVTRCNDLVKECFLCLTYDELHDDENNLYDIIKSVNLSIGGQLIEKYSGDTLRILASFRKKTKVMVSHLANGQKQIMFPLSLCTEDTHIPLVALAYHKVRIGVELIESAKSNLKRKSLYINYICLDTNERRVISTPRNPWQYRIFQKKEHKVTLTSNGPDTEHKIVIPKYMDAMRELIVLLKPKTTITVEEPVIKMQLNFNDNVAKDFRDEADDPMIYRKVIPRLYYDIDNNNELMYFMSFDHTPLDRRCSGCLNQTDDGMTLRMQLVSGEYEVCIVSRCFNVLEIRTGMATLKWPEPEVRPISTDVYPPCDPVISDITASLPSCTP